MNQRRVRDYPYLFLIAYVVAIVAVLASSTHFVDSRNQPVGTDFLNVWTAGKMAVRGEAPAVYDYEKHYAEQKLSMAWKAGREVPFYGWHYPPMFLLAAVVVAALPYAAALALWMFATLPAYLAAIRAILPDRRAVMAALAFPATFVNLGHGQNGFLTAGLLGGGLVLLEKRPWLAGVLFGLLAYKPQFGILLPLVLIVGGHWKAVKSATATVTATAALSYAIFGRETWIAFFQSLQLTRSFILERGVTGWYKIQSVFSLVRMHGGSIKTAYAVQMLYAVLAALAVLYVWRSKARPALKYAALTAATVMVTPYVLDYDLIVLALPIAWMVSVGLKDGFLPWEKFTLLLIWLLPAFSRMLGQYLHVPPAPFLMALLLGMVVRRTVLCGEFDSADEEDGFGPLDPHSSLPA